MVVIFEVPTEDTGMRQERTAVPLRWIVQAPHCPMPHPNFVPTSCRLSRKNQSSGVSAATSTLRILPLILRE